MSRYSDISKGSRARTTITFPLPDDSGPRIDLRALSASEEAECVRAATAQAKARDVSDPKIGNEIFDIARMVETLAVAALEHGTDNRFFSSSAEVWDLDRDTIQFLYQAHATFADLVSPRSKAKSPEEFIAGIAALASEDADESMRFFERCGPGLQWTYARTLAVQAVTQQTLRSQSGGGTATTTTV